MEKKKPLTTLEIMNQARDRSSMGRPTVMLTQKDKLTKRSNAKQLWRKELRYVD